MRAAGRGRGAASPHRLRRLTSTQETTNATPPAEFADQQVAVVYDQCKKIQTELYLHALDTRQSFDDLKRGARAAAESVFLTEHLLKRTEARQTRFNQTLVRMFVYGTMMLGFVISAIVLFALPMNTDQPLTLWPVLYMALKFGAVFLILINVAVATFVLMTNQQ